MMLLTTLFGCLRPQRTGPRVARVQSLFTQRLLVEPLEDRCLLSARPIADFVSAQGTTAAFVPPSADYLGWTDRAHNRAISVDYAGLANNYLTAHGAPLGTTTDGTINERGLSGGRAEVTVQLHTTNALTYVLAGDGAGNF